MIVYCAIYFYRQSVIKVDCVFILQATLNTVEDIKKWLPTVVRDIDFYVKV